MVDAAYSRKLQLGHAVVRARWQLIIPLVAAFVLIGGGWTVWAFSASKEAAPRAELSPKVGDGGNREGGISWGCLTPPLLHRRSDMPCPTITSSSWFSQESSTINSQKSCATGHVPFSRRRSKPRSRTFSASMPI